MGVATCWIGPGADHKSVVAKMGNRFDEARFFPHFFFGGRQKKDPGKKIGWEFLVVFVSFFFCGFLLDRFKVLFN